MRPKLTKTANLIASKHNPPIRRFAAFTYVAAMVAMTICLALLLNAGDVAVQAGKKGIGQDQKRAGQKKERQSAAHDDQQSQIAGAEQGAPPSNDASGSKSTPKSSGLKTAPAAMTFVVTVTNNDNGVCDASCSLREAINAANANVDPVNPDTIQFNIPGGGLQTINITGSTPQITDPVIIDGYTQPGSSANTNPITMGSNAVLNVELNGTSSGFNGLDINADNCVVRGLVINRFGSFGVVIRPGGENNVIAGNFIGTDPTGTIDRGNTLIGVGSFAPNNTIGGINPADRNIISGNNSHAVQVSGTTSTANTNKIQGNFIGTDKTGTVAIANSGLGVGIFSSNNNTIGGIVAGARNVIGGNTATEIQITGEPSDANVVQGNIIGLDVTGNVEFEASLFTFGDGVLVTSGADNNTIGGTTADARNIISGSNGDGVEINGTSTTGNVVQGNYIGTDATGTTARGNTTGVKLHNQINMTLGGTAAGPGNLISGNGFGGISIQGSSGSGNLVQGNLIGTDKNGTAAVGNGSFGVIITGASSNTVGGTTVGARNIISGNSRGVSIEGATLDAGSNTIQGNYIGVDINAAPLGNTGEGVTINFSPNNTIGGAAPGAGNIISNSGDHGVLIEGDATSGNNTIQSNTIANSGGDGVFVDSSAQNTIETNSIFGSGGLGIDLSPNNVTANDTNDPDNGANNRQNYPILNLPTNSGGNINISGTLNSTPSTQFRLEFFSNPTCDSSGFGEGQTFVGTTDVTTPAGGTINFNHVVPAIPAGHFLTATATAPNGDTSEFSQCAQEGPPAVSLAFSAAVIDDSAGNANGLIDVNECISLNIELRNRGGVGATAIATVLSSQTAGVTVTQPNSAYSDLATGNTGMNATPFKVSVPPDFGCGAPIALRITATTAQGVFIVDFQLPTNVPAVTSTFNTSGPAVPIPDDETNVANMPLNVSGIVGPITKVRVKMFITHPVSDDLDISLVGPDGTEVFLALGNGGDANFGTDCPADANDTIFDDDADTPIDDGDNPFVGTFRPVDDLTPFINKSGASVNGTWNLRVEDTFSGDAGTIQCWALEITSTPAVSSTFTSAGPVAIPDNNPSGAELPVTVSGVTGPIAKALVNLHLTHGSTDDLDISLVGPDGTTIDLSSDNGAGANYGTDCPANGNDTVFDDAAEDSITDGDNAFVGTFQSEQALIAFNGKSGAAVNGTWKLKVVDDETGVAGNIECWTLTILTVTCANGGGECAIPPAPEINVSGNTVSIADGDNSPTATDHTDFGGALINGGTVSRIFTIENTGPLALNLTGTPKVTIGGANAGDFSVTVQPSSPVSSGGGTTTFTVQFDPTASGLRTATLSIANNDNDENPYDFAIQGTGGAEVSVAVSPASVIENDASNLVYTFTRNDTNGALTVNFSVGGTATFNSDYTQTGAATFTSSTGTVTFDAGSATKTVTVDPTPDTADEPNETAILTVTAGAGYNAGSPASATGTITDDDPTPSISIADLELNEGNSGTTAFTFTVTLSHPSTETVTVDYATQNDSAIAPGDYSAITPAQTLTFVPGDTSEQFTIQVNGDTSVETNEAFFANLSNNSANATMADGQAVGTINNDDTDVTVAVSPASVSEDGATNLVYTFTRTGVNSGALTVNFSVGGTATFNTDYAQTGAATFTSATGTVTLAAANSTATVAIDPTADLTSESAETVILTVTSGAGYNAGSPAQATGTINNDDAGGGNIRFSAANYNTTEDSGSTTITVERGGDTTQVVTVDYATPDDSAALTVVPCATTSGLASPRCDFTTALGTLRFAAGETSKTFTVLISQDNYVEGAETLSLTLSNLTGGAVLGTPSAATLTIADDVTEPATSPIDDPENFVRQHYHDFLNREPDPAGLAFWTNEITSCGANVQCIEAKRIAVSASFFLSIEFQDTGYLVERIYKASYGDATGASNFGSPHTLPVPIVKFSEFMPDTQKISQGVIVLQPGWETVLENNKQAFVSEFVQRSRFATAYPTTLTPAAFVDALFANAGVTPSTTDRDAAINEFGVAVNTADLAARGRALRRVAENSTLKANEINRAFVLMQYFGYLRRDPNAAQDTDQSGYDVWLTKLNQFNGNFIQAEMVKAFLSSIEYRQRFGS